MTDLQAIDLQSGGPGQQELHQACAAADRLDVDAAVEHMLAVD